MVSLLKVTFSLALCIYLFREGLPRFTSSAAVFLVFFANFPITWLSTLKWNILNAEKRPLVELFSVYWSAQFAGLLVFGKVGTDVYRGYYLKERCKFPRGKIVSILVSDRVTSLAALSSLVLFFYYLPLGLAPFLVLFFYRKFASAYFLSVGIQVVKITLLFLIMGYFDFSRTFAVSLGLLVESLPLSWEGLGVGHLSFKHLIDGGVDIYQTYFLGKMGFKLTGIVPFFMSSFRRRDE